MMSNFSVEIDSNNVVLRVIVADVSWAKANLDGVWVPFKSNEIMSYPGIGFTYDSERDAFIPPKPFASWFLNEDSCLWESPIEMPTDGKFYQWDEDVQVWVLVEPPPSPPDPF